jgi:ATP-dependent RNA helicase RhlE
LILAPTRELAAQIGEEIAAFSARTQLSHMVIFGGVSRTRHVRDLRRPPSILVATPGRLIDLMNSGDVSLAHVGQLVLDEADRMLDMGFIRDVRRIIDACPRKRQTLLFSATMPPAIEELAKRSMHDPRRVAVDTVTSTALPIRQGLYLVPKLEKADLLIKLLGSDEHDRLLVFARTKRGADRLAARLVRAGIDAAAIHGNKSQGARERALQQFKERRLRVLVATDLASRGIDVKDLSGVLNYDLPNDAESYIHRVGRTGRAGASGTALSFCCEEELPLLRQIERLTREPIERLGFDGAPPRVLDATQRSEPRRDSARGTSSRRRRRRSA